MKYSMGKVPSKPGVSSRAHNSTSLWRAVFLLRAATAFGSSCDGTLCVSGAEVRMHAGLKSRA